MTKVILRPEVRKFAEQMELKLREHDQERGERGWLQSDVFWLAERILSEHHELVDALMKWPQSDQLGAVAEECADIGNFAMMVADVVYRYGVRIKPPPISQDILPAGYIQRHIDWSLSTFGEGKRTEGLCKHIAKELVEIQQKPDDIMEWMDVIILAIDGAWRAGYSSTQVANALVEKQAINFEREWERRPDNEPTEHKRTAKQDKNHAANP